MKLFVKVKLGAKENRVEKIDDINFRVFVREPPTKGKANSAMVKVLAAYFHCSTAQIKILSGFTSRKKIIEIGK